MSKAVSKTQQRDCAQSKIRLSHAKRCRARVGPNRFAIEIIKEVDKQRFTKKSRKVRDKQKYQEAYNAEVRVLN